ncbi:MAG: GntR family transcriptional regulator [Planctomycetes bacterium]|nr:GntR family transcriptional regulator [Planctomycetota bacterium]
MASGPRTIRDQVTDQIRDDVVAGNFPAGQPLRESEFAERFGVSRGPIRDAFLKLSQEGLLAYQANRGVTVRRPPDSANRDFIISLRRQIESYALQTGMGQLTSGGIESIAKRLDELKRACADNDVAKVANCDIAFHEEILTASGAADFLPVWKWLCSQMLLTYTRLENYDQVLDEHVQILDELRAGRTQEAVAALQANVR